MEYKNQTKSVLEQKLVAFKQQIEDNKKKIEDYEERIEDYKKTIEDLKSKLNTEKTDFKNVQCQTDFLNFKGEKLQDKPQICKNLGQLMDMNTPLTQQQGTFLSGKTIQSLTVSECSGIIIDHPNGSSTIVPQFYSRSTMPQPGPFLQFPLIPSTTAMMQSSSSSSFTRTKYSSKVVASHSSKAMTSRSSTVIAHHSSKAVSRSRAAQGHCSRAKHVASSSYSQTYTSVMRKIISKNNTKKHK